MVELGYLILVSSREEVIVTFFVNSRLRQYGLSEFKVDGDGNCQVIFIHMTATYYFCHAVKLICLHKYMYAFTVYGKKERYFGNLCEELCIY